MVVVDDFIPCLTGKTKSSVPAFTKSKPNELWVILLEKAYAKIYGSYEKINNGITGTIIHDLTGAPYENFDVTRKAADKLW